MQSLFVKALSLAALRPSLHKLMLTQSGQAVRSPVKDIRIIGRTTQGVRLINLVKGDKLIGLSKIIQVEEGDN